MIRELAASLTIPKQAYCFINNPSSQLSCKVGIINPILQRGESLQTGSFLGERCGQFGDETLDHKGTGMAARRSSACPLQ